MLHRYLTTRTAIPLLLLVWGCLLLSGGPLAAEEFPISLDRPEKLPPGTQVTYRAIRTGKIFSPSQSADVPPTFKMGRETNFEIELRGQIQIEQSPDSSQRSIKVTHFLVNDELIDEGFKLELKNQTLQIQEKNGKKKFQVNGTQIVGFDLEMLEVLFSVDWWGKAGTDKTFGTARAQTAGDSWSFQPSVDSMKKLLPLDAAEEEEIETKFECIGKAKLFGQTTIAGRDCLQFRFSESCPDCLSGKTSDGLAIVGSAVERTITGTLPVEPRLPWQKVNINSHFRISNQIMEPPLNGVILQHRFDDDVTKEILFP